MALAQRLIEQCTLTLTKTKTTISLLYFTTKTVSALFSSCCFTTVATNLLARTCTLGLTKLHDMLHGHSAQQPHCRATLLTHPPSRVRSSEFVVLENLPRLYSGDRFPTRSEQVPPNVIEKSMSIISLSNRLLQWTLANSPLVNHQASLLSHVGRPPTQRTVSTKRITTNLAWIFPTCHKNNRSTTIGCKEMLKQHKDSGTPL